MIDVVIIHWNIWVSNTVQKENIDKRNDKVDFTTKFYLINSIFK